MYKKAAELKLRIQTSRGELSVEQLFSLPMSVLSNLVKGLKKELKKDDDDELSFLDDTKSPVNEVAQLKFNIVKDIYLTKKVKRDTEKIASDNKAHNQKILEKIANLQDDKLDKMSEEELFAQLK